MERITEYYECVLPNGKNGLRTEVKYAFCDDLWREIKSYMFHPPHVALYISRERERYFTYTNEEACNAFNYEFKNLVAGSGIRGTKQFSTKKIDECKKHPLWDTYVKEYKKKLYNEFCKRIIKAGNTNWKPSLNGNFVDIGGCFHEIQEYYDYDEIPFSKMRKIVKWNFGDYPEPKLPKNKDEESWSDISDYDNEYYELIKSTIPDGEKIAICVLVQGYLRQRLKVFREKVDNARQKPNGI